VPALTVFDYVVLVCGLNRQDLWEIDRTALAGARCEHFSPAFSGFGRQASPAKLDSFASRTVASKFRLFVKSCLLK
jgi:hypothetical protein